MKDILIGIVLDKTLSFTSVFPQIYYCLEQMMTIIHKAKHERKDISVRYSVTLIGDDPEMMKFGEDWFCSEESKVLKALGEIVFSGGRTDETEQISEAVDLAYKTLCGYHPVSGNPVQRALIVLTDAMAADGDIRPDFTTGAENAGLQYGIVYSYTENYMPVFKMVNSDGVLTENDKNICLYGNLADLLKPDEDAMIQEMNKRIGDMLTVLFE